MGLIQMIQIREVVNRARHDADPRLRPIRSNELTSMQVRGRGGMPAPVRNLDDAVAYDESGLPVWDERTIRAWATAWAERSAAKLAAKEGPREG